MFRKSLITGIIVLTPLLLFSKDVPHDLVTNITYADSVIQADYGTVQITARATYIERLDKDNERLYRLLGVKDQGVWIIDITDKRSMMVVGLLPAHSGKVEDIISRGTIVYCLENGPLQIAIYSLIIPFYPVIMGIIKVKDETATGYQTFSLNIVTDRLQVLAKTDQSTKVIAEYDLGINPTKPILIRTWE